MRRADMARQIIAQRIIRDRQRNGGRQAARHISGEAGA